MLPCVLTKPLAQTPMFKAPDAACLLVVAHVQRQLSAC